MDITTGFYMICIIHPSEGDLEDHLTPWYIHVMDDGTGKEHNYLGQRTHHFWVSGTASDAIREMMVDTKLHVKFLGDVEEWDLFEPASLAPP